MRPPSTRRARAGMVGYAPGGYDMFHIGHLNLLASAWHVCDFLVAGVVTDDVLRLTKDDAPVVPLRERLAVVDAVAYVDQTVIDSSPDKLLAWNQVKFDVLFKGDDWKGTPRGNRLERDLAMVGARVVYFPYTSTTSSTRLRARLGTGDAG